MQTWKSVCGEGGNPISRKGEAITTVAPRKHNPTWATEAAQP